MDKGETNKQLLELVEQLKRENDLLKAKIRELEARPAQYENAHTPPSLRRGRNRKKDGDNRGNPGQKTGHKGVTRPYAKPDCQVDVKAVQCPDCGAELGTPFRIESKVVEEIPKPQPIVVTEYKIAHYRCPCCFKEVVGKDANCPHEGKFGNSTIAQATLLKYEDRLLSQKNTGCTKKTAWSGNQSCYDIPFDMSRR